MRSPLAQCPASNLRRQIDRIQKKIQPWPPVDVDKTPRGAIEIGGFVNGPPIPNLHM